LWYKANPEKSKAATAAWREANPDKAKVMGTRSDRKQGKHPYDENKKCSLYLGVHIAEQALSLAFKDVKRMPMGNPGYDVVCNHGKLIDIKSSCISFQIVDGTQCSCWHFNINHNTIADYFLCIAFDDRETLTPLHVWLIPGSKLNHLTGTSISPSTIHKWDEYRLDISKIDECCNTMRKQK